MELNKKGRILQYIKKNKYVRTKDIKNVFGDNGITQSAIAGLKHDKLIKEKLFECGTCKYWV